MLEELRKKPKVVRQQYAFFIALALTAIIGSIWFLSLTVRFGNSTPIIAESEEHKGAFARFFGEAKTQVANAIDSFRSGINIEGENSAKITEDKQENATTTFPDENSALNLKLSTTTIKEVRVGEPILISTSSPKNDSTNSQ